MLYVGLLTSAVGLGLVAMLSTDWIIYREKNVDISHGLFRTCLDQENQNDESEISCMNLGKKIIIIIIWTKDEHKVEHKTIFKTYVFTSFAKLAMAEGFELKSLSVWVRRLIFSQNIMFFLESLASHHPKSEHQCTSTMHQFISHSKQSSKQPLFDRLELHLINENKRQNV